jgi:hypothetical protein
MGVMLRDSERIAFGPDSDIHFETERHVRLARKVFLTISILLVSPLLAFGYFAIGVILSALHLPLWVTIPIVLFVVFITLRWIYRRVLSAFRFSISFLPEHLQVGRGMARCCLRYHDVEIASQTQITPHPFEIQHIPANLNLYLQCGKRRVGVSLNSAKMKECVACIRRHCLNAIIIDQEGCVHFPLNAKRAEQTLISLERHYRRIALECFTLAVLVGSFSLLMLMPWLPQRFQLHHGYSLGCFSIAVAAVCEGWASWRKLTKIRHTRMNAPASEVVSEGDDGSTRTI